MSEQCGKHHDVVGVPADAVYALGRLVLGAGRLEHTVRLMAADLYINPGKTRTSELLKGIRRCGAKPDLPPHATTAGEDLVKWVDDTRTALGQRDEVIHSTSTNMHHDGSLTSHLVHLRSLQARPTDAEVINQLATTLFALGDDTGWQLMKSLRHSPRPGVFLPNAVLDENWNPTCDTRIGGLDMARPAPEELDHWWSTLGPFPRLGEGTVS